MYSACYRGLKKALLHLCWYLSLQAFSCILDTCHAKIQGAHDETQQAKYSYHGESGISSMYKSKWTLTPVCIFTNDLKFTLGPSFHEFGCIQLFVTASPKSFEHKFKSLIAMSIFRSIFSYYRCAKPGVFCQGQRPNVMMWQDCHIWVHSKFPDISLTK